MTEGIIVAAIAALSSLLGTFGGILVSSKLLNYRVEQLEKQVEKHNNLIERTYELERKVDVIYEKVKVSNHRIEDLEHEVS